MKNSSEVEATESLPEKSQLQPHETDSSNASYDSFDEKLNKVESFGGFNEDRVRKNKKLHRSKTTILESMKCSN